jgi:hypothetical protein
MGRVIELVMEYAPQPPYGTGRPDLVDTQNLNCQESYWTAQRGAGLIA